MAIERLTIDEFLPLAKQFPVLDVRSPGEYAHAHIPNATSLPLFSDEERKVVGTAYKQQSKQAAIKVGLDYFGVKMKSIVEQVEKLMVGRFQLAEGNLTMQKSRQPTTNNQQPTLLVHCWRGGMRSAAVAWLLDLYGFKVYTLIGGYKAYRNWVLKQFEKEYSFKIIGGYTGSGKTICLQELEKLGNPTIDLEKLANHKGSAFGALGQLAQPSQEMFENLLAEALAAKSWPLTVGSSPIATYHQQPATNDQPTTINHEPSTIFLEDESQRIGNLQIPMPLWYTMRKCPVYFLDIPFEERLDYLTIEYGKFEKEKLVNAIIRIQKKLGGLETKNAINYLIENNHKECFRILLNYYDKWYKKGLHNRENLKEQLHIINCGDVNSKNNTQKIIEADEQ